MARFSWGDIMKTLKRIDNFLAERRGLPGETPIGGDSAPVVDKITDRAVADCVKIVKQAAKTASQQSGKPEGRLRAWIASKVNFALKNMR